MIVLLSDRLRGHLLVALDRHAAGLRRNGLPVPPELREVVGALRAPMGASDRQTPTPLDGLTDAADGRPMPLTVNYAQAGDRLGMSERTVQRLVADGSLPAIRVLGRRQIRTADLEAFVAGLEPVNGVSSALDSPLSSIDGAPLDPPGPGHSGDASGSATAGNPAGVRG